MSPESPDAPSSVARRNLLQASAVGICALCLARAGVKPAHARPAIPGNSVIPGLGLVRPRPAAWFVALGDDRLRCDLCPWQCELRPGQTGRCRVRRNHNGELETLAYGNPVLVQQEAIERLPFFHVRPGSRTLALSTAGCNLGCKFCEVWDMALVDPHEVHAYDMSPDAAIEQARMAHLDSISYAFGEPVVFYEYMVETAERARAEGLLNLMQTGGYIRPEPLAALAELMDAVNVDLKGFDPSFYRNVVGGELQPVLDTLVLLRRAGVHLEITNIVIPGMNDDMDVIERMCRWIRDELGPHTPLHFSRFYPLYQLTNLPQTPVSVLDRARQVARSSGLLYVYVSRVTGHDGENTYCPNCSHKVIGRLGFIVDQVDLEAGRCGQCGYEVPGRWAA